MTPPEARALITELYRGLLGREPDGGGLDHHSQALLEGRALSELMAGFVASPEFIARPSSRCAAPLDHDPPLPVDVDASPQDLARLWAHVGATWAALGEQDPYWSVLSHPRFRLPNVSDAAVLELFYASGETEADRIAAWLARHGHAFEGRVCTEFGCGVGRLTAALATRCRHVHAVDISPTHLDRARARLGALGLTNVTFHLMRDPADIAALPRTDLLICVIVLQHNPPPIIWHILELALPAIEPGGLGLIQIPTHCRGYAFSIQDYLNLMAQSHGIEMHCLPQPHVFALAAAHNLVPLEVQQDFLAGPEWVSHSFLFAKS